MLSCRTRIYLLIVFISISSAALCKNEELSDSGRNNYAVLKRAYDKWESGLFGSRKLYRNRLNLLLIDMIGSNIETGGDYVISIPDIFEKKYYSSGLYNHKWLQIHGAADNSSIKWFEEKGDDFIKEIERNRNLFFLSGRVENFRIVESAYGRVVHLYLESVTISDRVR